MTSLTDQSEPSELVSEYHSFLVRLWREHSNAPWRASVQSVQTGVTLHFPELTQLFAFLQAQTAGGLLSLPHLAHPGTQLADIAPHTEAHTHPMDGR